MPSPKAGTVSADPASSVAEFKVMRRPQRTTPRPASHTGLPHGTPTGETGQRHRRRTAWVVTRTLARSCRLPADARRPRHRTSASPLVTEPRACPPNPRRPARSSSVRTSRASFTCPSASRTSPRATCRRTSPPSATPSRRTAPRAARASCGTAPPFARPWAPRRAWTSLSSRPSRHPSERALDRSSSLGVLRISP